MKTIVWMWFGLLGFVLFPWDRIKDLLNQAMPNLMLLAGVACIIGVVIAYLEITIRGLRQAPPEQQ